MRHSAIIKILDLEEGNIKQNLDYTSYLIYLLEIVDRVIAIERAKSNKNIEMFKKHYIGFFTYPRSEESKRGCVEIKHKEFYYLYKLEEEGNG